MVAAEHWAEEKKLVAGRQRPANIHNLEVVGVERFRLAGSVDWSVAVTLADVVTVHFLSVVVVYEHHRMHCSQQKY